MLLPDLVLLLKLPQEAVQQLPDAHTMGDIVLAAVLAASKYFDHLKGKSRDATSTSQWREVKKLMTDHEAKDDRRFGELSHEMGVVDRKVAEMDTKLFDDDTGLINNIRSIQSSLAVRRPR